MAGDVEYAVNVSLPARRLHVDDLFDADPFQLCSYLLSACPVGSRTDSQNHGFPIDPHHVSTFKVAICIDGLDDRDVQA